MSYLLPLLSVLACAAMMFGAGALVWLGTRTPLRRIPALAHRAQSRAAGADDARVG